MDEIALFGGGNNPEHDYRTCKIMKSSHCGIFCSKPSYYCPSILYEAEDGHCYCPMYNMHKNGATCFFTHFFVTGFIIPFGTPLIVSLIWDLVAVCWFKMRGPCWGLRLGIVPNDVSANSVAPTDTERGVDGQISGDLPTYNEIDAFSVVTEKSFIEKSDSGLPGYDELDEDFF